MSAPVRPAEFVRLAAYRHAWRYDRHAVAAATRWVADNWQLLMALRARDVFGAACRKCGAPTTARNGSPLPGYCVACGREADW